jgi:tetratricopeptide (TPR) repeat protein
MSTYRVSLIIGLTLHLVVNAQEASEWFGKGLNAFNNGNYGEAVVSFTRAIEQDSSASPVWFNRGTAYMRMRMFEKSYFDLTRCLQLRPSQVTMSARMQRAVVGAELGLRQDALRDVTVVIEQDSTFPKARLLRGRLRLGMGDTTDACRDFASALRLGDSSAVKYLRAACR